MALLVISSILMSSNSLGMVSEEDDEVAKYQDFPGAGNAQNKLSGFANETRDRFHTILLNMSRYIPVSIEYAEEVGKKCNIIENNSHYYGAPALVFAAVLFVVGALFCFVGKHSSCQGKRYVMIAYIILCFSFLVGKVVFPLNY